MLMEDSVYNLDAVHDQRYIVEGNWNEPNGG